MVKRRDGEAVKGETEKFTHYASRYYESRITHYALRGDDPMKPKPIVSVVMPVLNPHPVYFRQAVESILNQTFEDWELVIVEDPSPRQTIF